MKPIKKAITKGMLDGHWGFSYRPFKNYNIIGFNPGFRLQDFRVIIPERRGKKIIIELWMKNYTGI